MTRYVAVPENGVPLGETALLLYVQEAQLCAGTLEHRCDGRLVRSVPSEPQPTQLVSVICELIDTQSRNDTLYIVIEPGAYWPETISQTTRKTARLICVC